MAKDIVMMPVELDVENKLRKSVPENGKGEQTLALTRSKEDKCTVWLNENYELKRNEVTKQIEQDGKDLAEPDVLTIFLDCKRETKVSRQSFFDIINSTYIKSYNPIKDFFNNHEACTTFRKYRGIGQYTHLRYGLCRWGILPPVH